MLYTIHAFRKTWDHISLGCPVPVPRSRSLPRKSHDKTPLPANRRAPCLPKTHAWIPRLRPPRDGLDGGGRGRAAAVPVLLRAVDAPAAVGGPVRPRRRPVPPHGAGLPRAQGAPAPGPRLRRLLLVPPAALLPRPPCRRPVPQLQVSIRIGASPALLCACVPFPVSEAPPYMIHPALSRSCNIFHWCKGACYWQPLWMQSAWLN